MLDLRWPGGSEVDAQGRYVDARPHLPRHWHRLTYARTLDRSRFGGQPINRNRLSVKEDGDGIVAAEVHR